MSIRRMNESFDRKFQEYNLNEESEKFVVYTQMGDYYVTPKSNYGGMMQNSRKVHHMKDFTSAREVIDYWNKYFHTTDDDFEVIDEGYELLSGTKVKCFRDYYKAKKVAEEAGLKESEYGDAYGISYCCWNTSGDRNEDEEVVAWYAFDGGKPRPLTDEEAENYERKLEVEFDDFDIDESCKKESLSTDLGEYQKWVDYDMERYGHISAVTHKKIKDAGLSVVKDQYGQYEVIADRPIHESVIVKKSKLQERGLTKAERHNHNIEKIFGYKRGLDEFAKKFLSDKGYDEETIYKLYSNDTLGKEIVDKFGRETWSKVVSDYSKKNECKESLFPSERREFISKMTKALMGDKFGYSREEANDIAIKRADALGDDWRVRWGGDIDKEIKQELENTMSKVGYRAIHGIMADGSKLKETKVCEEKVQLDQWHFTRAQKEEVAKKWEEVIDYIEGDPKLIRCVEMSPYADRSPFVIWFESLSLSIHLNPSIRDGYYSRNFREPEFKKMLADLRKHFSKYPMQFYINEQNAELVARWVEEVDSEEEATARRQAYERDWADFRASLKNKPNESVTDESKLKEGKRGFVRKYKGCSIHDAGDVFVCTNEHGLNIGQSRTESGCEGLIDEYIKNKGAKNESKLSEHNLAKADESLKESQSQELAQYYRELKGKNGFDVARLANEFYKTPEWKEIGFQGDVLFTKKGWNAFKKWAKETKNVDIKDLESSDDFLGEGRLTEKKWRYTLKNGKALRDAIETEDYTAILAIIQLCYQELNEAGLIDDDDCDRWVQDIDDIDTEDATYDDIDWELDQFYDLCDNIGVWIPINEEKCNEGTKKVGKSINREVANDIEYYYSIPKDDTLKYLKINKIVLTDDDWSDGNYDKLVDDIANKVMDNFWQLGEDTVKQGSQWVNKGKEGTHGKFKTKKEADAQRAAMYARGFKG